MNNKTDDEIKAINMVEISSPIQKLSEFTENAGKEELDDLVYKPTTVTFHYEKSSGFSKYFQSLKHLLPVRVKTGPGSYMPVDESGCYAFTCFSWLTPLIWRTFRKGISIDELYYCSPLDSSHSNSARFSFLWNKEVKKVGFQKSSLSRSLFSFIQTRFIIACLAYIMCLICGFIGPIVFLRHFLYFIQDPQESEEAAGISWMVGLLFMEVMRILLFSFMWAVNIRTAIRVYSAVTALLYKKVIKLSSMSNISPGELVNLFTSDCSQIFLMIYNLPLVIGGPVLIASAVIYMWWLFGPFCFIGVAVFIMTYIIQFGISYFIAGYRKQAVVVTDKRVSLMSEFISNMKQIKLYSWEKHLIEKIRGVRLKEKKLLEKIQLLHSAVSSVVSFTSVLATIFIILAYTLCGYDITPAEAFTLVMVNVIASHGVSVLPICVRAMVNGMIAMSRLEVLFRVEGGDSYTVVPNKLDVAVCLTKASLDWEPVIPSSHIFGCPGNKKSASTEVTSSTALVTTLQSETGLPPALSDVSFTILKGQLVGVCGPVGSGKSSLLSCLIGQMHLIKGQVAVRRSIAYVPQQSWILNATLKENVLFGHLFSSKKYYEAIYSCGLTDDIAALPAGDQTQLGDTTACLSGGQKQRICLARAQYADKELYLLDDPLSAVDATMANHIFQHCIRGALKDKSILLVTHDVKFLEECDIILFLQDGAIMEQGSHQQLLNQDSHYAAFTRLIAANNKMKKSEDDGPKEIPFVYPERESSPSVCSDDSEVSDGVIAYAGVESENHGKISWSTYLRYMQAAGGLALCCFIVIIFFIHTASNLFSKYWLGYWLSQGDGNVTLTPGTHEGLHSITANPDLSFYQLIYGMCVVVMILMSVIVGFFFTKVTLLASNCLHDSLLVKLFSSPMYFFDNTPAGKILNVLTNDIQEVDSSLPSQLVPLLYKMSTILLSLLLVAIVYGWFVLPLLVLATLYLFVQGLFRAASNDLSRAENATRSPVIGHVASTARGLSTIRAFQKEDAFFDRFTCLLDTHISARYLYYCSLRWLGVRTESLGLLVTLSAALLVILLRDAVNPAFAAMSLTLVLQASGMYQYLARLCCSVESRFTSVERIESYAEELEPEPQGAAPPEDWPPRGRVQFCGACMRYGPGLPLALRSLTFDIEPQEKVGIVGRTGAGKSSLAAVLFRLVELSSGEILVDGVNIRTVAPNQLRKKLAIIPQQPILFSGTLRYNLDPENEFRDEELWNVLSDVDMKNKVSSLKESLQATVAEDGSNFSVGEKQLLCMARALLHKCKVLVLDEATSSVDDETDQRIQHVIRESLAHSTLLVIAHRLSTVAQCDRVMVLQEGKVVEFDQPTVLLANPKSHFSKLVSSSHSYC